MSALRLQKYFLPRVIEFRYLSTALPREDAEYTTTPQYPPILDLSFEKKLERKKEAEYEEIKAVKTVEEKQIKLNMPRYYGFKCYMQTDDYIPYNNLTLAQHITRTHLIKTETLPEFYSKFETTESANSIKNEIEEAIGMELDRFRKSNNLRKEELTRRESDNLISSIISKQINRIIMNQNYPHLKHAYVDFDSRIESFWFAGGMNPPERIKKLRERTSLKCMKDEPTNRAMNYIGSANVAIRVDKPLRPIVPTSEAENPDLEVPVFNLDPRTVGTKTEFRHIANVPGFWPGDPNEFAFLSYHNRGAVVDRHYDDAEDNKEALDRNGILASFGWLNAQANFMGFTTYNDITYPLVTQTVITNGQIWSFYVYQLNTIQIHSKYVRENPKRNICWATPELKLYEEVVSDKLMGFNDEVLKNLLKFYSNEPEDRLGVNLKPYLSKNEKVCADYEDNEKREWLEQQYKHIVSNRPRHRLDPEIYAWEKIYKIDHQTRPLDKKLRPFELKIDPWKRKLNERQPKYIPRCKRPDLPRSKGRWAKDFWP